MPRATFLTLRGSVYYARIPLSKSDQRTLALITFCLMPIASAV